MANGIQVINARGVIEALGGWSGQAKRTIADVMTHSVEIGNMRAIVECPVDTGYLKSRQHMQVLGWTSDTTFEVDLLNDANYALFVDKGTVHQPSQPFFDRGVAAAKVAIKSHLDVLK